MKYLLDTNVVSEGMKANPEPLVAQWILGVQEPELVLSVIAMMELRQGIDMMPEGKRRQMVETWLVEQVTQRFRGRILGVDTDVADICGQLLARQRLSSSICRMMDIWLAAIALHHDLTIVSRNERDFQGLGVSILNPWTTGAGS